MYQTSPGIGTLTPQLEQVEDPGRSLSMEENAELQAYAYVRG